MSDTYAIENLNKIRQLSEKAVYDKATVHGVLDAALVATVGFVQDGAPVVVPMIFGREDETIFLHGARKARVVRLLEQTENACLNVTLVDGVVFARSAFNSSMNYRSATVFGRPRLVDDYERKLHALRVISEHTMPGRWEELRAPLEKEVRMTGVIALNIDSASAKISSGMPDDEDEDYAIPIWAGVLPVRNVTGVVETDDRVIAGVEPSAVVLSMQNRALS
ncbi:MAG: pyridoxamine 5'-phosphate oxidase family protein [Gammaproteobacteria bacterium]|nr:pyridoxamine 5'-phosphate oxidase family protein [Gammaproteobacteria bacterium]